MKITKLEHACLDITDGSTRLIVDPGVYSVSLTDLTAITAMVITHLHPDHFDEEKVSHIIQQNPEIQIFTTGEVGKQLPEAVLTVPELGKTYQLGTMQLEFFGGQHATISQAYPTAQNVGVLVNDALYYPGDSLVPCPKPHKVLAAPTMAPWLKFSEADEFIMNSAAQQFFSTHNGFLNEAGQEIYDRLFHITADTTNKVYLSLKPGESLED